MAGVAWRIPHTQRYINPDPIKAHAPQNTNDMLQICSDTLRHYISLCQTLEHCVWLHIRLTRYAFLLPLPMLQILLRKPVTSLCFADYPSLKELNAEWHDGILMSRSTLTRIAPLELLERRFKLKRREPPCLARWQQTCGTSRRLSLIYAVLRRLPAGGNESACSLWSDIDAYPICSMFDACCSSHERSLLLHCFVLSGHVWWTLELQ